MNSQNPNKNERTVSKSPLSIMEPIVINPSTQTVLVTGGFGFIGSHLVEALLMEPDVRVHVVDSLITSPIDVSAYLKRLEQSDRITYDICSVKEYFSCKDLPAFDEVYHLA